MATVDIGNHPDLTVEYLYEVFQGHFAPEYEVYYDVGQFLLHDFVVKKSGLVGCGIMLTQRNNTTVLELRSYTPSRIASFFDWLLGVGLIMWPARRALEREVRSFIEGSTEFK